MKTHKRTTFWKGVTCKQCLAKRKPQEAVRHKRGVSKEYKKLVQEEVDDAQKLRLAINEAIATLEQIAAGGSGCIKPARKALARINTILGETSQSL